jgi:hypothetical protein
MTRKLTQSQHAQDRARLAEFLAKHQAAAKADKAAAGAQEARSQRVDDVIPWIG